MDELIQAITFLNEETTDNMQFVYVDNWKQKPEDQILKHCKGFIIMPVSNFYQVDNPNLDLFAISKRCYNNPDMREHCTKYLNYFLKFYDVDKELLSIYCRLKYLIDFEQIYGKEALLYDLDRYILHNPSILNKIECMNADNYTLTLNYRNKKDPSLEYTEKHANILLAMSILMNMVIPILNHFIFVKKIEDSNSFVLEVFDRILHLSEVDIYNKLYNTAYTNVMNTKRSESGVWDKQAIRGKNFTTHAIACVNNIILQIMPKYKYEQNIIMFNYRSIINNTSFQITDIAYEFDFKSLSSTDRDVENDASSFDRFESGLIKSDEALYIQNKVNCQETMNYITNLYGPFSDEEIKFYIDQLQNGEYTKEIINSFQKELVFNLVYKYFGDPMSANSINSEDYIKLIISVKRMLESNRMIILPYIISSRVIRIVPRKNINKRVLIKLESSPSYIQVMEKYKSEKIKKKIHSLIATLLVSDFAIIDYDNKDLNGKSMSEVIMSLEDILCEEISMMIDLIS